MPVLDQMQFDQLVVELREALETTSQGVSEVLLVDTLDNLVSLPALRLIGATETVVEAPIELLSLPAVEAAAETRDAIDDSVVATVDALASADLSDAARKNLEEVKERTVLAGADATIKGDKAFAGAVDAEDATLRAMQIAGHLQTKLEQAQVVILSGKANQDVLDSLDAQVKDSILICVRTREDAYTAILQLRELQKQVAGAILDAYVIFDQMQLSTTDARIATELATRSTAKMAELSEQTQRVIIESVMQTGAAKQTVTRLEDLEVALAFSKGGADTAATRALVQADQTKKVKEETELVRQEGVLTNAESKRLIDQAEQVIIVGSATISRADASADRANEKGDQADAAAEGALESKINADIAAARALVGEQRALDAAVTVGNIVSGIRPDWASTDKTSSNYIANKPEIPTLEGAPTPETLTYLNIDDQEVAYKIGDEVRVWDVDEYVFYKLYDIKDGVAAWDEVGGSLKHNIYLTGADHLAGNIIKQGILNQE